MWIFLSGSRRGICKQVWRNYNAQGSAEILRKQKLDKTFLTIIPWCAEKQVNCVSSEGQEKGSIVPAPENTRKKIGGAWSFAPVKKN
jgi:hypothetical protein